MEEIAPVLGWELTQGPARDLGGNTGSSLARRVGGEQTLTVHAEGVVVALRPVFAL